MKKPNAPVSQAKPTQPRPIDRHGRTLDQWGLPVSGPARARELERLGKPDPRHDAAAWTEKATADQSADQGA